MHKSIYTFLVITGFITLVLCKNVNCQSITDFSTDLPLFIIDTEGQTIVDEPKITAKLKIIDNKDKENRVTDEANGYDGIIGIELRGSSSQSYPQKPYLFETRDETGQNLNVSLLGLPEENDWILLSNYNDKSFMRNILGYELFRKLGHYAPRAKLVEVIINNEYKGIYVFTEKIKRDKNRIDIAKLKKKDIEGEELTGGYIFKIDYWTSNDSWLSPYHPINHLDFDVHFIYHDPDWDKLQPEQKNYIKDYVTSFEEALYSTYFKDNNTGYPNYIDVESFIDYFLVSEVSRNNDGFKKSRYFHKDKNGKIVAGPVWDFDWAWKNINECYIFKATDGSGWSYKVNDCNPWVKSPGWMVRLFYDDNFRNKANCRYFDSRENALSNENIFSIIDSLYNVVGNAQTRHFGKYQILGRNVGAPEVDEQPVTYEGEVEKLKNWITTRLQWLDNNMIGTCSETGSNIIANTESIKVYPNPATSKINILSESELIKTELFNALGTMVSTDLHNYKKITQIDISHLPPGVYFLKSTNVSGEIISVKIFIQ